MNKYSFQHDLLLKYQLDIPLQRGQPPFGYSPYKLSDILVNDGHFVENVIADSKRGIFLIDDLRLHGQAAADFKDCLIKGLAGLCRERGKGLCLFSGFGNASNSPKPIELKAKRKAKKVTHSEMVRKEEYDGS